MEYRIYTPKGIVKLIEGAAETPSIKSVSSFVQYLHKKSSMQADYILHSSNVKELKKRLFSQYQIIKAAGGIVVNEQNEILLIYRRGFWDLPKGKIDAGETKRQAAIREVEEEVGISNLEIVNPLELFYNKKKVTYHTYRYKRQKTIKASYWYIMKTHKQPLIPQKEEDIEQAKWVKPKEIKTYLPIAYPAIRDVLQSI